MATTDTAPNASRRSGSRTREEHLEDQIARLQEDLKSITASIARISNDKVAGARQTARSEYKQLVQSGQSVIDDVGDQASALEKQLKDTIREKPLTAVAGAIGIGFLFALLSRR